MSIDELKTRYGTTKGRRQFIDPKFPEKYKLFTIGSEPDGWVLKTAKI